ncbi:MAG: ParA family protein [Coriobacteriia bacterium]|nr:ParA family protein [Coriobacteriia bacterium]
MNITLPKLCIITGYYGVGKTNLSLNLVKSAMATAGSDDTPVTLVDLDIINPYFRSSDYIEKLRQSNVELIAPTFARAGIETPALPAAINGAFESMGTVIIDVGGDDAGATTLARYHSDIQRSLQRNANTATDEYFALWYVINRSRSTQSSLDDAVAESLAQLREIETACKLQATGIVNNTHLQDETDIQTVHQGLRFGQAVANAANLPLIMSTYPSALESEIQNDSLLQDALASGQLQSVELLVTTPWQ